MKKFLLKLLLFACMIALCDVASGFVFDCLKAHARGGDTYKAFYVAERCTDDIVILGSSRAARHFNPQLIEDSLHLSCYNAGQQGCGIIPGYARYKMLTERSKPKLIIYEVFPEFDYLVYDDYSKYVGSIRQFQNHQSVKDTYHEMAIKWENVKNISMMYRNNSCFAGNVRDILQYDNSKGYIPLFGEIDENASHQDENEMFPMDTCMATLFERLIRESKEDGVSLILIISPKYKAAMADKIEKYNFVFEMAEKYGVPLLDYSYLEGVSGRKEYFNDYIHLNNIGAEKFTNRIIPILRNYCGV